MEMTRNALNWFEIPVSDFDRARRFYSAIFDFDMPTMQMGPQQMGFLLHDQNGGVGGAIVAGPGYTPSPLGTLVYLAAGNDLSVVLARVVPSGGTVLTEKFAIGEGLGFVAYFADSEGNRVGVHSPH